MCLRLLTYVCKYVPAGVEHCCDEGSATSVLLEQSTFSLESGNSSPPPDSNRLSLENSGGGKDRSRGQNAKADKS